MRRLRSAIRFVYDFVVGDDPLVAVCVVLGIALTALAADAGIAAWWVLPGFVVVALSVSVFRQARG